MSATRETAADIQMKMAIVEAMSVLLENVSFERIKAKELCDAAHISRQTFYRYFHSKDAVPVWYIDHFFEQGTFQIGRTLTWHEGHLITLRGMARAGTFFHRLELPRGCVPLRQYGTQAHLDNLRETVAVYHKQEMTDRLEFQIDTFVRTRTDITKKWIYDEMVIPPEVFADYTDSIIPSELFELLKVPALRK
jgi:AcrR family transcriptional regulator